MLQDVLADPKWDKILIDEDRCGLSPDLAACPPVREVKVNMRTRLVLGKGVPQA